MLVAYQNILLLHYHRTHKIRYGATVNVTVGKR